MANVIPDAGASPAYLAKAIARAAGLRPPSDRPGISLHAKAAAAAAHVGGRSAVMVRGVDVPGALADAHTAFTIAGALLGTTSWLHAAEIEQRLLTPGRGLGWLVAALDGLAADQLLWEPEAWPILTGIALIEPDDDPIAVRGRELGTAVDHTATVPVAQGSRPIWCGLPRVVASKLRAGRMPKILKAYTFRPDGVVNGARLVRLPGGIIFDPRLDRIRKGRRFRDLPLALSEVGLLAKAGRLEGVDELAAARLVGSVKVARNVAAYGGAVESNPSLRAHRAWGPDGKLSTSIHEEPGSLSDPVAGSLVVAGCELLLTLLECSWQKQVARSPSSTPTPPSSQ